MGLSLIRELCDPFPSAITCPSPGGSFICHFRQWQNFTYRWCLQLWAVLIQASVSYLCCLGSLWLPNNSHRVEETFVQRVRENPTLEKMLRCWKRGICGNDLFGSNAWFEWSKIKACSMGLYHPCECLNNLYITGFSRVTWERLFHPDTKREISEFLAV